MHNSNSHPNNSTSSSENPSAAPPAATPPSHRPVGRPSQYSPELAEHICDIIASSTKSLRVICEAPEMPSPNTIYRWLRQIPEFREMYAGAREVQSLVLADEILEIADASQDDWKDTGAGEVVDREAIMRSKLRIASRQWLFTHLMAKKYQPQQEEEYPSEPMVSKHLTLAEFEECMRRANA